MSEVDENSAANSAEISAPRVIGRPFQKGVSGNPSGRPKSKWLTEVVEELLQEKLEDPVERAFYKENIWAKLNGKNVVSAMTLDRVWERTEGKLPTTVEGNLTINVTLSERMKRAEERLKGDE